MIVPNLTRAEQARVLDVLTTITHLSAQAVTAAFMDADKGRLIILDPLIAIRKEASRARAYGVKAAARMSARVTGQQVAASISSAYGFSPEVGGMILGAAVGLRLGLELRLARTPRRPISEEYSRLSADDKRDITALIRRLAHGDTVFWFERSKEDAPTGTAEDDLEAARRWARDMGRAARKSTRPRSRR